MSVSVLIFIFFILASLPWLSEGLFVVISLKRDKRIVIRLLELLVYYLVALLVSIAFETRFAGEVYEQGWEFFVTTFCLYLLLAVPAVLYRYQWLAMQQK